MEIYVMYYRMVCTYNYSATSFISTIKFINNKVCYTFNYNSKSLHELIARDRATILTSKARNKLKFKNNYIYLDNKINVTIEKSNIKFPSLPI